MHSKEDATNQATSQQQVLVTVESQTMNVELHSRIELPSNVELQNEVEEHSNSKISGNNELPDKNVQNDSNIERSNEETRAKPRLSKYVKRHHPTA